MKFESKHFELEKLKDGIYAAIAKEGGGSVGNAGFIDLGCQTIVFDTFNTQQAAEDLNQFAKKITGQSVTWVINSHWHGDHIRGNQVFKDSHIISSHTTYEKMKELHPDRILKQKNDIPGLSQYIMSLKEQKTSTDDIQLTNQINFLKEIEASLPTLELVLPYLTFNEEITFQGTKRTAKLITLGGGHSFCDAMLYLPEEKVIFMGDLLFVETHPSLFEESYPENWIRVLNKITSLDIDIAIPGHGQVGKKSNITSLIEYLRDINEIAKETTNVEEITMPFKYTSWSSPETYIQNVKLLRQSI